MIKMTFLKQLLAFEGERGVVGGYGCVLEAEVGVVDEEEAAGL